jgi:hypothetical protein
MSTGADRQEIYGRDSSADQTDGKKAGPGFNGGAVGVKPEDKLNTGQGDSGGNYGC